MSYSGVLGCAEVAEKAGLSCVPNWCGISENGEDYRVEYDAPLRPLEATD